MLKWSTPGSISLWISRVRLYTDFIFGMLHCFWYHEMLDQVFHFSMNHNITMSPIKTKKVENWDEKTDEKRRAVLFIGDHLF